MRSFALAWRGLFFGSPQMTGQQSALAIPTLTSIAKTMLLQIRPSRVAVPGMIAADHEVYSATLLPSRRLRKLNRILRRSPFETTMVSFVKVWDFLAMPSRQ